LKFILAAVLLAAGPSDVDAVRTSWARAWSAKALDETVSLYADDATFFPTGLKPVLGRDAIRAFFKSVLEKNTPTISFHSDGVVASGELAYDHGQYEETIVERPSTGLGASGASRSGRAGGIPPAGQSLGGLSRPDAGSPPLHLAGSYLFVYRRDHGKWLITAQMWTETH
jgi:uncharacterized protein (TIGR02246 family)